MFLRWKQFHRSLQKKMMFSANLSDNRTKLELMSINQNTMMIYLMLDWYMTVRQIQSTHVGVDRQEFQDCNYGIGMFSLRKTMY